MASKGKVTMSKTKKRKSQSTPGVAFESTVTISEPMVCASKRRYHNSPQTMISKQDKEGDSKATNRTQEVQAQVMSEDIPLKDILKRKVFSSFTKEIPRSTVEPHIEATSHVINQEGKTPDVTSTPKRAQYQVAPTQNPQTFEGTESQTQPRRTKEKHTVSFKSKYKPTVISDSSDETNCEGLSSGSIGLHKLPSLIPAYPLACQVPGDPNTYFFPKEKTFDSNAFICSLLSNGKKANQNKSSSHKQNVEPRNHQTKVQSVDHTPNAPSQTSSPKVTPSVQPSHADTTANSMNDEIHEVPQNQQTEIQSVDLPPNVTYQTSSANSTPPVQPSHADNTITPMNDETDEEVNLTSNIEMTMGTGQTSEALSDSTSKATEYLQKVTKDPVVVMARIISGEVCIPTDSNRTTLSKSSTLPSVDQLLSQLKHIVFNNQFSTLLGFEQSIQAIICKVEAQQDKLSLDQDKALAGFICWFKENIKLSQDLNSLENSLSQAFTKQDDYKEQLAGKEISLQQTKESTVAAAVKIVELDAVISDLEKKLEQAIEQKQQLENAKIGFQDKEKEIIKSIEVISTECLSFIVSATQLYNKKVIVEQQLEASKAIYEDMKKNPPF